MESFGERLSEAFSRAAITQRDLAAQVGVGQPTVSQWIRGQREPEAAMIERLATILDVTPEWLLFGRGAGPREDVERLRLAYRQAVRWLPAPENPDGSRAYGSGSIFTLQWRLDTLIREVLQNGLDVVLPGRTGRVRISLIRLSGTELRRFLTAMSFETLRPHIEASAGGEQQMGAVLSQGLAAIDAGELWLLRIADYNTYGLTGDDFERGRFMALTRNSLDSDKAQRRDAGGSYGIGKAVLWAASSLGTVLFCSDPVEHQGAGQRLRILGKSELAWHELPETGERFAGPAWFGEPDDNGVKAWSVWDNPALASDLHLARGDRDGTGTSILVVGFDPPGQDAVLRLKDVAGMLEDAAAAHFWPAVGMDRLQITVDVEENGERSYESEVSAITLDAARCAVLDRHETGTYDDALIEVGDVVRVMVPLEVPARVTGSPEERHPSFIHHAEVLVRRSQPEDGEDWLRCVEYFRGAGMVVKKRPLDRLVVGAHPFHVAVFAGLAAGSDVDAERAEQFLKAAEPVEHNDWLVTPRVKSTYARGGGAALTRFFSNINAAVREVLQPAGDQTPDGPRDLADLFRLGAVRRTETAPTLTVNDRELDPSSGAWYFDCEVRIPKADDRKVRGIPVLKFDGETGAGTSVRWSTLQPITNCSVEDGYLIIEAGRRTARFRAESDPASYPARPEACSITIEFRAERIAA